MQERLPHQMQADIIGMGLDGAREQRKLLRGQNARARRVPGQKAQFRLQAFVISM